MKKYFLGIDIGTSSVKLLVSTIKGETVCVKTEYESNDTAGWCKAIESGLKALRQDIPLYHICAISLSAQVGTYITDKGDIVPWFSSVGEQELKEIKETFDDALFVNEIGMTHPDLISYPLPRLLFIKRNISGVSSVIMPKETILKQLTGNTVTDTFSQRGICNPIKNEYSEKLLNSLAINFNLPKILNPTDLAGYITKSASNQFGLAEGTAVYVGCNDFYAGLLGMGVLTDNTVFELSGTSEHIGVITRDRVSGSVVSSRYFNGYVSYGGTKASGTSCDFAINNFNVLDINENFIPTNQPIFLPYLKGERAPIYDEKARGVFFGISDKTTAEDMAYSVLEGVVFSLYHIADGLPLKDIEKIIVGGGSTENRLMARLKAELFGSRIIRATEGNSSALGAALIAMVGHKEFSSFNEAVKATVKYKTIASPQGEIKSKLLSRFEIYKSLYSSLKNQFNEFSKL